MIEIHNVNNISFGVRNLKFLLPLRAPMCHYVPLHAPMCPIYILKHDWLLPILNAKFQRITIHKK